MTDLTVFIMRLLCSKWLLSKHTKCQLALGSNFKSLLWNFCRKNHSFETEEELRAHKESLRKYNKASFDYEYLFDLRKSQLVYKIIRMQRQLDSYTIMRSSTNVDGRDKVRVEHPDIEDMVDHYDYNLRRVAFKVAYLGWDYMAYAWSTNADKTIKGHTNVVERIFLEALLRQQLIQRISPRLDFDRCGRTDKDVSGLGQVICANLRTNLKEGYGVWQRGKRDFNDSTEGSNESYTDQNEYDISDGSKDHEEIPYVKLLNEALPMDIRVLAWSPVSKNFSPRRRCLSRTYRYFLPRGSLDVDLMREAAQKLVGKHDFINFAKLSADNMEKRTVRNLKSFEIDVLSQSNVSLKECDMIQFTITGSGFVYRQIRLMIYVLCRIGNGCEDATIIDQLLDVENSRGRPNYGAVSAVPLILYDCEYGSDVIDWRWDQEALKTTAHSIAGIWCDNAMKSEITKTIYDHAVGKLTPDYRNEIINSVNSDIIHNSGIAINVKKIFESDLSKTQQEFKDSEKAKSVRRLQRKGMYKKAAQLQENDSYEEVGWKS